MQRVATLVLIVLCVGVSFVVPSRGDAPKPSAPPAPTIPVDGTWHNKLNSEMELKYDQSTHSLTGHYKNAASPATPGAQYQLTGTVNGDIISFTVNWGKPLTPDAHQYQSITTWVGQVHEDPQTKKPTIRTIWVLGRPQKPELVWNGVTVGSDVFIQGPAPTP